MSPQKQSSPDTGPRTEAGRARSSQNSIHHSLCSKKHLIVPEDRPEFDLFYSEMIEALPPDGVIECTPHELQGSIRLRRRNLASALEGDRDHHALRTAHHIGFSPAIRAESAARKAARQTAAAPEVPVCDAPAEQS